MNELATYQHSGLPDTIEDLSRFVLVGREKLTAVRAAIRAIDRAQLAREVRDQKMEEAQMLSEALLDAETRLGDMTKQIPRVSGRRSDLLGKRPADTAVDRLQTKEEAIQNLGLTPKQVERFEILADNKDLVEQVKQEARANDDIPTRTRVINLAKHRKQQQEQEDRQIGEDAQRHKAFIGMVYTVLKFVTDEDELDTLTDALLRSDCGVLADDIKDLDTAIGTLQAIKNMLIKKGANYGKK